MNTFVVSLILAAFAPSPSFGGPSCYELYAYKTSSHGVQYRMRDCTFSASAFFLKQQREHGANGAGVSTSATK